MSYSHRRRLPRSTLRIAITLLGEEQQLGALGEKLAGQRQP